MGYILHHFAIMTQVYAVYSANIVDFFVLQREAFLELLNFHLVAGSESLVFYILTKSTGITIKTTFIA